MCILYIQIAIHTDTHTHLCIQRWRDKMNWVEPKGAFRVGFAKHLPEGKGGLEEISMYIKGIGLIYIVG